MHISKSDYIGLLIVLFLSFLYEFSEPSFAETIVLTSGKRIQAKIIEEGEDSLRIDMAGVKVTIYNDQIREILDDAGRPYPRKARPSPPLGEKPKYAVKLVSLKKDNDTVSLIFECRGKDFSRITGFDLIEKGDTILSSKKLTSQEKDGVLSIEASFSMDSAQPTLDFDLAIFEELSQEAADLAVMANIPPLGQEEMPGIIRPGAWGRFVLERMALILGGKPVLGIEDDKKLLNFQTFFMYGKKFIGIPEGKNNVLVIIARLESPEKFPLLPPGFRPYDQLRIYDSRGKSLASLKDSSEQENVRYFICALPSPEGEKKVTVCLFTAQTLQKARYVFNFRNVAVDVKK